MRGLISEARLWAGDGGQVADAAPGDNSGASPAVHDRGTTDAVHALGVAAPMALRRAVPAVYHEDPLFLELCGAFDELMSPLVSAVDCFAAYLDPHLAPDDFLPWLAALVGCSEPRPDASAAREQIADAVRSHALRGTAAGIRAAAARAADVPEDRVELDDPGGARWSATSAAAHDWPNGRPRVRVRVLIAANQDSEKVASAVRAAMRTEVGVHCRVAVEVVLAPTPPTPPRPAAAHPAPPTRPAPVSPTPSPPAPEQPPGPRMYGGQP